MTAGVDLEDERTVIGAQKSFVGFENRMSLIHRTSDQATAGLCAGAHVVEPRGVTSDR